MKHALVVAAVVIVVVTVMTVFVCLIIGSDHDREIRYKRNTEECLARGGTVIWDEYNDYTGCKFGPKAGG